MSNQCGGCTLCCTLERIPELSKPRYKPCEFCEEGVGCLVYRLRPHVCRKWHCWWLLSDLDESFRPDRIHLYAHKEGEAVRVMVDPKYPDAWKQGHGARLIEMLVAHGHHVFVAVGDQINFVCGEGKPRPDQITLQWVL